MSKGTASQRRPGRAATSAEAPAVAEEELAPAGLPPGPPLSYRLLEETFGDGILKTGPLRWYFAQPIERRQLGLVILGCLLMFVPFLGAVGLWDPWEPHYGEVGRQMMVRHDWIRPWWESTYFFSKPPLTMWLTNLGLIFSGAGATIPQVEMGPWTEWGMRTPNMLLSVLTVAMVYLAASRVFNRRVGLVAALALATMPLFDILARQAVTDMPFVALLTSGLCCLFIAEFDPSVQNRRGPWLYAFYAQVGLATLAKEIPFGLGIPGGIVLAYLLLTWDWPMLRRVRLMSGGLLCLAIAAPWVLWMCLFSRGVDDENETFVHRYWLHDNFQRLFTGVHTTTPNTSFVYFIEQLGYNMFPWSALLPAALLPVARLRPSVKANRPHLFVTLWALVPFFVVAMSATKFHHYAFPCLPPLAILLGLFIDQLWNDGLEPYTVVLLLAATLFAMIGQNLWANPKNLTDMFVYNYDRPYPTNLIADTSPILWALLGGGGAVCLIGLMLGGKGKAVWGGAVAVLVGILFYLQVHLAVVPNGGLTWSSVPLTRLAPRDIFGGIFIAGGLLAALAAILARREWFIGAVTACALGFACYLSWVHWEQLSPNWSQRDIFHTYYSQRKTGEPIAAYYMNWRGETFYSKNDVRQIKDPGKLREFIAEPGGPDNRHWVIVEQLRFNMLRQALGDSHRYQVRDDSDNKFFLVSID